MVIAAHLSDIYSVENNEDYTFVDFHSNSDYLNYDIAYRNMGKMVKKSPPVKVEKVPTRNEKCSCGSGKKYKKCCI